MDYEYITSLLNWGKPLIDILGNNWDILGDYFGKVTFRTLISKDKLFIIQEEWVENTYSFICVSNDMNIPLVKKYWSLKDLANRTRVTDFPSIVKFYKELYE